MVFVKLWMLLVHKILFKSKSYLKRIKGVVKKILGLEYSSGSNYLEKKTLWLQFALTELLFLILFLENLY